MISPKNRSFFVAIVGVLPLVLPLAVGYGVGYGVGYRSGQGWTQSQQEAKAAKLEAQVRHLVDLAYPENNPCSFVGSVPPGAVMKDVHQNRNAPDVVRAILYDQVQKEFLDFTKSQGQRTHELWYAPSMDEYIRRMNALQNWAEDKNEATQPTSPRTQKP